MTAPSRPKLRVALLSTAALDLPGSMRAYAETLVDALSRHAPDVEWELVELEPSPAAGRFAQRWQTVSQPWRARWLKQRPHVWHVLDGSRAYLAAFLRGAPVVVTVHDVIPWLQDQGRFPGQTRLGRAARAWWQGNGRGLRHASSLVCDSACSARDVQEAFNVPRASCSVVPLPLRSGLAAGAAMLATTRDAGTVLHVGNNAFYKNRAGALRIFACIGSSVARELVMAGPPPSPELLSLVDSLGLGARVRWLREPSDAVLADAYRRSTLMLFPSLYEGFGWPVLEAMSYGLPVLSSDAGSLPELAGDAVPMFPPGDEAGFAAAAEALLSSPEAALELGRRGRERALAFNSATFATSMAEAYVRSVSSKDGTSA